MYLAIIIVSFVILCPEIMSIWYATINELYYITMSSLIGVSSLFISYNHQNIIF
jgi:hypothetical protein